MNLDLFKQLLVAATAQSGLQWEEDEKFNGNGCCLLTNFTLPRYYDDCSVQLFAHEDCILMVFTLDRIVPSYDNLKLINDFNTNVSYLSAAIELKGRGEYFLTLKAPDLNVTDENDGVSWVGAVLNYILSDAVAPFLRPLTVITQ